MGLTFRLLFLAYLYSSIRPTVAECPKYQVPHSTTTGIVCCHPVLLCPRGSQIKFCTANGGSDTCEKCPPGRNGTYITSSLDPNPEQCFQYHSEHAKCALDDNVWIDYSRNKHGMPCRCDESRCYYGSPSEAGCLYKVCGKDTELDPFSGDCKPCGPLKYNNGTCGVCWVNETAWRLSEDKRTNLTAGQPPAESPPMPSPSEEVVMATTVSQAADMGYTSNTGVITPAEAATNSPPQEGGVSIVLVVIIVVVLLLIGIVVAVILIIRRKLERNEDGSRLVQWYRRCCSRRQNDEEVQRRDEQETKLSEQRIAEVKPFQEQGSSNGHIGNDHEDLNGTCEPLLEASRGAAACGNEDETQMKTA